MTAAPDLDAIEALGMRAKRSGVVSTLIAAVAKLGPVTVYARDLLARAEEAESGLARANDVITDLYAQGDAAISRAEAAEAKVATMREALESILSAGRDRRANGNEKALDFALFVAEQALDSTQGGGA